MMSRLLPNRRAAALISEDAAVGRVVIERPGAVGIFEHHGIRHCHQGQETLRDGYREEPHRRDGGRALAKLRKLTVGFEPPADTCGVHRTTLEVLAEFERNLHHEENNVFFPKAMAASAALPRR